ncbi:YARHG domain-containing protein [Winogradskyella undariae]|uniref:YARHG domain-containing protein n=1 Tax=Winogradskyella undariae TaxID=1285465 RepID=UPI00156BD3FC|nr:YARHG domain-containing protein [Winogradskyella undariae]NRR92967.1 YARHG domain-containing protein [Winogradskyella undariae]
MKKLLFFIIPSLLLTSCLDHLLESEKKDLSEERINIETDSESDDYEKNIVEIDKNSLGLYPFTSHRLLTLSELRNKKYSENNLKIMRNEIFARHGYIFMSDSEMDHYFRKQNWYKPMHKEVITLLSKVEKNNIDLIISVSNKDFVLDNTPLLEEEAGGFGYILVENLRLRDKPNLDGETIELLKKDSFVNVDKISSFKTTIELNGNEISDVWFAIISETGKSGWVHGCCIDVTWP